MLFAFPATARRLSQVEKHSAGRPGSRSSFWDEGCPALEAKVFRRTAASGLPSREEGLHTSTTPLVVQDATENAPRGIRPKRSPAPAPPFCTGRPHSKRSDASQSAESSALWLAMVSTTSTLPHLADRDRPSPPFQGRPQMETAALGLIDPTPAPMPVLPSASCSVLRMPFLHQPTSTRPQKQQW